MEAACYVLVALQYFGVSGLDDFVVMLSGCHDHSVTWHNSVSEKDLG